MNKLNKRRRHFLLKTTDKIIIILLLSAMTSHAVAANKGNISAAVTTLIVGAIMAVLISLLFALHKNQDGRISGLQVGKFFLILSVLLLIVFVAGTAAFFIFM